MKIIAITGLAFSGKSTTAQLIKKKITNQVISEYMFAEKIKKLTSIAFDEKFEMYDNQILKKENPKECMYTRREILQKTADFFRSLKSDIFEPKLDIFDCDLLLISDMRFMKEYNLVKNSGYKYMVIKIFNKNVEQLNHNSEKEVSMIPENILIDNSDMSLESLSKKIDDLELQKWCDDK